MRCHSSAANTAQYLIQAEAKPDTDTEIQRGKQQKNNVKHWGRNISFRSSFHVVSMKHFQ